MRITLALLLCFVAGIALAEPVTGPVIEDYGPVYYVPDEPLGQYAEGMKAVFDVAATPLASEGANRHFVTVARYLNMHARAGVDPARMDTAVVLHGRATRSALGEDAFAERYGERNPDAELLRRLADSGVRLIVCGQSAAAYGFRPEELAPDVELSLSALTALVALQSEGYALIPWGAN